MNHDEVTSLMHIAEKVTANHPHLHKIRNHAIRRLAEIDAGLADPVVDTPPGQPSNVQPPPVRDPGMATTRAPNEDNVPPGQVSATTPSEADVGPPTEANPSAPVQAATPSEKVPTNQPPQPHPEQPSGEQPPAPAQPTVADSPLRRI